MKKLIAILALVSSSNVFAAERFRVLCAGASVGGTPESVARVINSLVGDFSEGEILAVSGPGVTATQNYENVICVTVKYRTDQNKK